MAYNQEPGFWKSVKNEWKKIQWPNGSQIVEYTAVVLIITAIIALFCWILDFLFGALVNFIL